MAAWLAYLKSCLLLPREREADPSPEELAMRLQMRLQRLAAMREAGARLLGRDRLGRDVFLRGAPEGLRVVRRSLWRAELYDLIAAYGSVRARSEPAFHIVARRPVMTLEEALARVERMIGARVEWTSRPSSATETASSSSPRSPLASSALALAARAASRSRRGGLEPLHPAADREGRSLRAVEAGCSRRRSR